MEKARVQINGHWLVFWVYLCNSLCGMYKEWKMWTFIFLIYRTCLRQILPEQDHSLLEGQQDWILRDFTWERSTTAKLSKYKDTLLLAERCLSICGTGRIITAFKWMSTSFSLKPWAKMKWLIFFVCVRLYAPSFIKMYFCQPNHLLGMLEDNWEVWRSKQTDTTLHLFICVQTFH